jgi:hypothetical protein
MQNWHMSAILVVLSLSYYLVVVIPVVDGVASSKKISFRRDRGESFISNSDSLRLSSSALESRVDFCGVDVGVKDKRWPRGGKQS